MLCLDEVLNPLCYHCRHVKAMYGSLSSRKWPSYLESRVDSTSGLEEVYSLSRWHFRSRWSGEGQITGHAEGSFPESSCTMNLITTFSWSGTARFVFLNVLYHDAVWSQRLFSTGGLALASCSNLISALSRSALLLPLWPSNPSYKPSFSHRAHAYSQGCLYPTLAAVTVPIL